MLGLTDMLKDGYKHLSGRHEAVLSNIEAVRGLGNITKTSLGPNGLNKIIVNHLQKLFVTSDAATIIHELDVAHPAAKLAVLASQMQEQEVGDGTNLVLVLCAELLNKAEVLIEKGLHTSDIILGYEKSGQRVAEELESLVNWTLEDLSDVKAVARGLKSALAAKQFGYEDLLSDLVADACVKVLPKNPINFNVDNVRVAKIPGGGVLDTSVLKGHVLTRGAEGTIKQVSDSKVAVFAQGFDVMKTETKDTVVLKTADALLNFTKSEEREMENFVKALEEMGVKIVVSGNAIGELALHFLEQSGMMVVKVPSKFELRRVCKTVGAIAMARFELPRVDQLGHVDFCGVDEIGSTKVTIFRQDQDTSRISTIVVRGSTQNLLDDFERSIDDGVNVYKACCKDARFVAGAGATEIELATRLQRFGDQTAGLTQHSIRKYGEAFESVPQVLAENAGLKSTDIISELYGAHAEGNNGASVGIDVIAEKVAETDVLDNFSIKANAIRLATEAACTILRVDQLIMAKTAGGPKPPKMGPRDA